MTVASDGYILTIDDAGVATVGFDFPGKVNIMNDDFMMAMPRLLATLEEHAGLSGVVLTSHKSTFFAGGDLSLMLQCTRGREEFTFDHFELLKSFLRRLEKLGVPLVAAINGTALGGGYELCLACHHRIALANPKTRIGLPEVNFGILPAAGGVIRLTSVLGILPALDFLTTGHSVDVNEALKVGLIDEIADTETTMMSQAKAWILAHPDVKQRWDQSSFGQSAPQPSRLTVESRVVNAIGEMSAAAARITDVAMESLRLDFDSVSKLETRGFVDLVASDDAQAKIAAFFQANSRRRAG